MFFAFIRKKDVVFSRGMEMNLINVLCSTILDKYSLLFSVFFFLLKAITLFIFINSFILHFYYFFHFLWFGFSVIFYYKKRIQVKFSFYVFSIRFPFSFISVIPVFRSFRLCGCFSILYTSTSIPGYAPR